MGGGGWLHITSLPLPKDLDLVGVDALDTKGTLLATEGCVFLSSTTFLTWTKATRPVINLWFLDTRKSTVLRHWALVLKFLLIRDPHKLASSPGLIYRSLPTPWPLCTLPRSLDRCPALAALPPATSPGHRQRTAGICLTKPGCELLSHTFLTLPLLLAISRVMV